MHVLSIKVPIRKKSGNLMILVFRNFIFTFIIFIVNLKLNFTILIFDFRTFIIIFRDGRTYFRLKFQLKDQQTN